MALTPGTRLGVYEVTAQIGVNGMGEVYRAHDRKLGRDVALKVLPDAFTSDPDRLVRFQREGKTLASLNHPNIAAIYGLEEADGVKALVMELVEGDDLAQRLARGPMPLDDDVLDWLNAHTEPSAAIAFCSPADLNLYLLRSGDVFAARSPIRIGRPPSSGT